MVVVSQVKGPAIWEFQKYKGLWKKMEPDIQEKLNNGILQDATTVSFEWTYADGDKVEYICDLKKQEQINSKTGYVRKIRRVVKLWASQ